MHERSFVVYSRPVEDTLNAFAGATVYDLFLQPLSTKGEAISLTANRRVPGLGRSVSGITIDASGNYVAFCSDDPIKPKQFPPRLTEVADHLYSYVLWVCSLRNQRFHLVPMTGAVEAYEWNDTGTTLAIEKTGREIVLHFPQTGRLQSWLKIPDSSDWAWWKNGEAILYHDKAKILLRSIRDRGVLKQWNLPEKAAFYRLLPSPDGRSLLVATDSSLFMAQEPGWRWQRILPGLGNEADATFFWLADSKSLVLDRVGCAYADFGEPHPTETHHRITVVSPLAQSPPVKEITSWGEGSTLWAYSQLFGVANRGNALFVLRGNSKRDAFHPLLPDILEVYDTKGRKASVRLNGRVDSVDVHFGSVNVLIGF